MKVLFISRSTLYSAPGGDTVQIASTAKYLRRLGVAVSIILSDEEVDYASFDLLHCFNISRPADLMRHVRSAAAFGKPVVISPIFVDYSEYEKQHRSGIAGVLGRMLSSDQMEYAKVLARRIMNGEKISSNSYILKGQHASVKYLLKNCSMLLPNSENEYRRLQKAYHADGAYRVIPNGVDAEIFGEFYADDSLRNKVLCAARIEGVKNQLNLVRALNDTPFDLVIAGKASPNGAAYEMACRSEAKDNIKFKGHLSAAELYDQYLRAKVHVLPSWFETTGLSSLEAAVMGCNIVISDRGDSREYFQEHAWYCDPADPASIRKKVEEAFAAPQTAMQKSFRQHILQNYTWEKAAEKTLQAYREVLVEKTG